jgi:hypothetical protein
MDEPALILFEYDLDVDCGVRLVVSPAVASDGTAAIRFEVNVDGDVRAAYVGPKDVDHLIAFLQRNRRG